MNNKRIVVNTPIYNRSDVGRVRQNNQDSSGFAATPNGQLYVVCDGMGGHAGGEVASRLAVDNIIAYLGRERYANMKEALNEALVFANNQILGYAAEHPELKGMGTTACIVLVQDSGVWTAHVGDSRIYVYQRRERNLLRLTKDHSYVQTLVDSGQISEEEAESHPQKNIITQALGIKSDVKPSIAGAAHQPVKGDVFIISSDGLTGMVDDSAIASIFDNRKSQTIDEIGDRLIDTALENGGKDNVTVQLIEIINSPYAESLYLVPFSNVNPKSRRKYKSLGKILLYGVAAIIVVLGGLYGYRNRYISHCQTLIKQEKSNSESIQFRIDSLNISISKNRDSIVKINRSIQEFMDKQTPKLDTIKNPADKDILVRCGDYNKRGILEQDIKKYEQEIKELSEDKNRADNLQNIYNKKIGKYESNSNRPE